MTYCIRMYPFIIGKNRVFLWYIFVTYSVNTLSLNEGFRRSLPSNIYFKKLMGDVAEKCKLLDIDFENTLEKHPPRTPASKPNVNGW